MHHSDAQTLYRAAKIAKQEQQSEIGSVAASETDSQMSTQKRPNKYDKVPTFYIDLDRPVERDWNKKVVENVHHDQKQSLRDILHSDRGSQRSTSQQAKVLNTAVAQLGQSRITSDQFRETLKEQNVKMTQPLDKILRGFEQGDHRVNCAQVRQYLFLPQSTPSITSSSREQYADPTVFSEQLWWNRRAYSPDVKRDFERMPSAGAPKRNQWVNTYHAAWPGNSKRAVNQNRWEGASPSQYYYPKAGTKHVPINHQNRTSVQYNVNQEKANTEHEQYMRTLRTDKNIRELQNSDFNILTGIGQGQSKVNKKKVANSKYEQHRSHKDPAAGIHTPNMGTNKKMNQYHRAKYDHGSPIFHHGNTARW